MRWCCMEKESDETADEIEVNNFGRSCGQHDVIVPSGRALRHGVGRLHLPGITEG